MNKVILAAIALLAAGSAAFANDKLLLDSQPASVKAWSAASVDTLRNASIVKWDINVPKPELIGERTRFSR